MPRKLLFFLILCLIGWHPVHAQQKARVFGTVADSSGTPLADVNISVLGKSGGTTTNELGKYELKIASGSSVTLGFSFVGRPTQKIDVPALKPGQRYELNVLMANGIDLVDVKFSIEKDREKISVHTIDPRLAIINPSIAGFEAIIKTLPGVTSNNELSSQYNVRGGNYDENLVYVNDIEIYRPFLVRSGQQEGLSFINQDLVSSIKFSAGGFEARYGDKLSSVLDIKYREPKEFKGSASGSLLGGSLHLEGSSKNHRFTYLLGTRYRTNRYILNSLDVQGDYRPAFADIQAYLTYHFSSRLRWSLLTSYSNNRYLIVPQSRETVFGTVTNALKLFIAFNGQELMRYQTGMGGTTLTWDPNKKVKLKLIASAFRTAEDELFTVEGAYRLDQLESDFGSDNFGETAFNRGVGYFIENARNELDATVFNISHRGYHTTKRNRIQWGVKYQHEIINDRLHEWRFQDSSDFAIPGPNNGEFVLEEFITSKVDLRSNRFSGYVQNSQTINPDHNFIFAYGIRTNYWDLNQQNVVSPRLQVSIEPNRRYNASIIEKDSTGELRKRDVVLKAAFGYYYQPPFYRELRNIQGEINRDVKAQRSIHFVLGGDMNFTAWGRPFKFFAETYYKKLDNLVPYEIENVRIRYYAENLSNGYAAGLDMKVNGEFVKGVESWASLSILQTQEDLIGDFYYDADSNRVDVGFVPRPTDQRVNFSLFFQDYLPNNPSVKMNLSLIYGSGLPFGPPDFDKFRDTLRMPSYRRVDIGFSKLLVDENLTEKERTGWWAKTFTSAWLSLEVFNLLQVNNTISHIWVKDVENRTYAVPNFLTSRRVNLRLQVRF